MDGKIFVISDTHFNHKNIIEYCNRPFKDVEEMNAAMIENWNRVVGPDDYVIHCGDFSLGRIDDTKEIVSQLNGHKILVRGNHDHNTVSQYKGAGFESVFGEKVVFDIKGKKICFSHHKNEDTPYLNLYGHVHNKPEDDENHICVCVEVHNYTPVLLDDLIK